MDKLLRKNILKYDALQASYVMHDNENLSKEEALDVMQYNEEEGFLLPDTADTLVSAVYDLKLDLSQVLALYELIEKGELAVEDAFEYAKHIQEVYNN